jgi:hypothetical protein
MAREGIIENVGGFLGDVAGGVGDFVGGVGEHLGTGLKSVRDAERAKLAGPGIRNDQVQINQLIQTAKALDPADVEGQAVIAQKLQEFPAFSGLQGKLNLARQGQADRDIATKKIGELARAASSAEDFITDDLRSAIGTKINQSFADIGIVPEASTEVTSTQKTKLSSLFSTGLESLKKTSPLIRKKSFVGRKEFEAFETKFKTEAAKAGATPSAAAALFGELQAEEESKPGGIRNFGKPKASGLFKKHAPDAAKAFEKFVQVGTEDFPEDNVQKPMAEFGITSPADQQTFQEIVKAAPEGVDIQAVATSSSEGFKLMMKALQKGKDPSGKPYTIKEFFEDIGLL